MFSDFNAISSALISVPINAFAADSAKFPPLPIPIISPSGSRTSPIPVINNEVEASKIPPEWHSWIHFVTNQIPDINMPKFSWQKKYVENLTGTSWAHKPDGSLRLNTRKNMKKYEVWKH